MLIYTLMPVVLLIAILCIALEDKIKVNKAAVAMLSAIILWGMLLAGADPILGGGKSAAYNEWASSLQDKSTWSDYTTFLSEFSLLHHLGDVATTLFFVMCSMVIIDLVDVRGGFQVITQRIHTTSARRFLWIVSILTFILSALLDNLATAILMVAILRKFVPDQATRWIYASMVVIAANAGGSWSPIGDVTTILLWTGGNLSPAHQISTLILPAIVCMVVPVTLASLLFFKKGERLAALPAMEAPAAITPSQNRERIVVLIVGMLSLALVPLFNSLTGLPPFMGVMVGLSLLWIYTDLKQAGRGEEGESKNSVLSLLHRLDMGTILFFFGILMSIAAINTAGQLTAASTFLDNTLHNPELIAAILGVCSSFLDNVALVAGAMGMYPITTGAADPYLMNFATDGAFWTFLAYCCVTGGSILIIGSATGVSVMGMEKIGFGYYLKRFTLLAIAGFGSGAAVYLLLT